jgi:hypothetical protein
MKELSNQDEYRGFFISEFAKLERAIDLCIATYFIPSGVSPLSNQIISILIDRITFENKRTALKKIFDIKNKADMSNHKNTGIYKKIINALGELARIRNYFAHYYSIPIPDDRKMHAAIGLVQQRDSNRLHIYTIALFYKEVDKITLTREAIEKFIKYDHE